MINVIVEKLEAASINKFICYVLHRRIITENESNAGDVPKPIQAVPTSLPLQLPHDGFSSFESTHKYNIIVMFWNSVAYLIQSVLQRTNVRTTPCHEYFVIIWGQITKCHTGTMG